MASDGQWGGATAPHVDVRRVSASAPGGGAVRYPLCDPLVATRLRLAWGGFCYGGSPCAPHPRGTFRAICGLFATAARLIFAAARLPARRRRASVGDGRPDVERRAWLSAARGGTVAVFL